MCIYIFAESALNVLLRKFLASYIWHVAKMYKLKLQLQKCTRNFAMKEKNRESTGEPWNCKYFTLPQSFTVGTFKYTLLHRSTFVA